MKKYDTRHGHGGYDRQVHPRAEKALLAGLVLIAAILALAWWL